MIARIAIPSALSHPVWNPFLNTPIQAMKATMNPIMTGRVGSPTIAVSKAAKMKNTIAYMMGPRAVTSMARLNVTLPRVRILAATHTGIETIIHSTSRPIITVAAINAISVPLWSKNCWSNAVTVMHRDLRAANDIDDLRVTYSIAVTSFTNLDNIGEWDSKIISCACRSGGFLNLVVYGTVCLQVNC